MKTHFKINNKEASLGQLFLTLIVIIAMYIGKLFFRACGYFVLSCAIAYVVSGTFNYSIDIMAFSLLFKLVKLLFFIDMFKFGIGLVTGKHNVRVNYINKKEQK